MKLEQQVLTIDQVRELQELGFNIEKHASMCWVKYTSDEEPYEETYHLTTLDESCYETSCLSPIPTLTIGDIMEILPERIKDIYNYDFQSAKLNGKFIVRYNNYKHEFKESYFIIEDKIQINALFETLKWCIKEKHIAL